MNAIFQSNFLAARHHLEQSLTAIAQSGQPSTIQFSGGDLEAASRSFQAIVLMLLGYPNQAQTQARLSLARARGLKNHTSLALALMLAGEVAILWEDGSNLQTLAEELLQLEQTEETPFFLAYGLAMKSYARVMQAEAGSITLEDLALMKHAMQMWEATGSRSARGQWLVHLADGYWKAGQVEDGIALIADGLALITAGKSIGYVAEIFRMQGELLLQHAERRAAEASFEQALLLARQQSARLLELRAAVSLAKLWRGDRPIDARRLLEEICARFSEGQTVPTWQAAQALLNELASSSAG